MEGYSCDIIGSGRGLRYTVPNFPKNGQKVSDLATEMFPHETNAQTAPFCATIPRQKFEGRYHGLGDGWRCLPSHTLHGPEEGGKLSAVVPG